MLGDRSAAEELTQETFLAAYKSIRGLRGEKSPGKSSGSRCCCARSETRARSKAEVLKFLEDLIK